MISDLTLSPRTIDTIRKHYIGTLNAFGPPRFLFLSETDKLPDNSQKKDLLSWTRMMFNHLTNSCVCFQEILTENELIWVLARTYCGYESYLICSANDAICRDQDFLKKTGKWSIGLNETYAGSNFKVQILCFPVYSREKISSKEGRKHTEPNCWHGARS